MGELFIPFGIGGQSLSAFDPTDGIPDHADMDIARENVRFLMARDNLNELELAKRSGVGQSWINRWLNYKGPGQGIRKAREDYLGMIGAVFGVTNSAIMFTDLTQPGAAPPSQPVGQGPDIIAAAVKIEAMLADLALTPPPKDRYPQRLFVAGQVVREIGAEAILSGERLVDGVRALAARLRAVGEG